MRPWFAPLLVLLITGCADEGKQSELPRCAPDSRDAACDLSSTNEPESSACAIGQSIRTDALAALKLGAPSCYKDSDCVTFSTNLDCKVARIDLCSAVMHRDAAAKWDPDALCARLLERVSDPDTSCAIEASCIAPGLPRCRGGACVAAHL